MDVFFHLILVLSLMVLFCRCNDEQVNVYEKITLKLLKKVETLEAKVKMLEIKNLRHGDRQGSTIDTPVAFTATLTQKDKSLGDHQSIEYDHVITDVGNGYDSRTGRFTCPVKGLYLFAVTLMSNSHGGPISTEVVKDGTQIAKMFSTTNAGSSTTSVSVITLDVGEMVWVRTTAVGTKIHGDGYDTFSGTLIYQIP